MTNKNTAARGRSPHVERGVGDFFGERFGEERERLILGLELAAVGERIAMRAHGPFLEKNFPGWPRVSG